ncbi:GIN domain-containing protein [Mangrovibacterium lignilyticum]|uniref:GIN domain-containing protein n=1 Tax=Mangrovibacterium lignilyticum TaxID=2668052 RepID=UPI0013CF8FA7|nr:DUF2807 domain-containing protein [Mangrovibacterium lignilyticum]
MRHSTSILMLLLLLSFSVSFTACHYSRVDDEEEKSIPVTEFDKIYVKGNFTILLEQGTEPALTIRGLKETLETTEVTSDTLSGWLKLSRDKFSLSSPQLVIRFRDLSRLRIEGAATVETAGYLDLNDLDVRVEGGARLDLKMKAQKVSLRGEGGVVYELEGVSRRLESNLQGAAYLKASAFETDTADINIEGVGVATIHVNDLLKAHMEGMGKISYTGDPEIDQRIDGLGKISRE